jgi:carbon storage regulator
MLVLSRTAGKAIIIDHDVVVTVLSVQGNTVRFGITAPAEIAIHREEVYQRLQQDRDGENPEQEP